MPIKTSRPVRIPVPGRKLIEEYVGRASTQTSSLSVAHMIAPPGWSEPFQSPAFDEATIVIRGAMRVEDRKSTRLNSSHVANSYAALLLEKKKTKTPNITANET